MTDNAIETVTEAARRDVMETATMARLADAIARRRAWRCSERAAHVRVCQMLNGQRDFHADDLPTLIKVTRRIGVLGPITQAVVEMQAELQAENEALDRPGPAVVRRERERRRGVG